MNPLNTFSHTAGPVPARSRSRPLGRSRGPTWSLRWGSDWIKFGDAGHIDVDSGYGPFTLTREWATAALKRPDAGRWRTAA